MINFQFQLNIVGKSRAVLLLMTWTVTLATEPTEAWQAYWPLSVRGACLTSREELVLAPFSVI